MDQRAITSVINGQKGGKPPGSKSERTLIKEQVKAEMYQRIFGMTQRLVNAQYKIAIGTHKMVQMIKGPGDTMMTRTIRDEEEMQRLLDEGEYGIDYIILVGKEGDWKAANALLDRAMGKAKETLDINATVENVTLEDKEKADRAVQDYLFGRRGVTVNPEVNKKPLRADDLTFKSNG